MALFNWFGHKAATPPDSTPDGADLAGDDATLPIEARHHRSDPAAPDSNSARKQERLQRREALYQVVRDCMTQMGVLSSTYKFKVLSLDSHGRQYLIMVDIPHGLAGDPTRFSEIEGLIARSAKARHEILVTAVYWRLSELISGANAKPAAPASLAPAATSATPKPAPSTAEKVAALDILFANQNAAKPTDFQDTQVDEHAPELGKTQYGDLN